MNDSILDSGMRSYEYNPGDETREGTAAFLNDKRFKNFSENISSPSNNDIGVSPVDVVDKVSYGLAEFNHFNFREVFVNGKTVGEYHIGIPKCNDRKMANALMFFREKFKQCEVGIIDPTNELKLEFQIYIKTDDYLLISAMLTTMEVIDQTL